MTGPRTPTRCTSCYTADATSWVHGKIDPYCKTCLGRGVIWSDGRPFTMCPGAGVGKDELGQQLACGRTNDVCPGCSRRSDDIGGDADRAHTLAENLGTWALKVAVVMDPWKRSVFERHLSEAGYTWEAFDPGPVLNTIMFRVICTTAPHVLAAVVKAANDECAKKARTN